MILGVLKGITTMKNTKSPRLLLLAALTAMAPLSWAQVSGTVNCATGAASNAANAGQRPIHQPSAAASGGVNAVGQAGANAHSSSRQLSNSANAGNHAGANAHSATSVNGSVDATRPLDSNAGANVNSGVSGSASSDGRIRGNSVSTAATGAVDANLTTSGTGQIRQMGVETREAVLSAVNARLDANERAVDRMERSARRLEGDVRTRANSALEDVRAKEKNLRNSLKEVRKASSAELTQARERLAADYEAYSQSIATAEASLGSLETRGSAGATGEMR